MVGPWGPGLGARMQGLWADPGAYLPSARDERKPHQSSWCLSSTTWSFLSWKAGWKVGKGVDHLVLGVQHEAMPQTLRARVTCSDTGHAGSAVAAGQGKQWPGAPGPQPSPGRARHSVPARRRSGPAAARPRC